MKNYALTWTDAAGTRHASRSAYDKTSADHRQEQLQADGATDVQIVEVKPGQLPQV